MAIYHCTTKPISRSAGRSAVAAAAYRAGESITDERTGKTHDYTKRHGVLTAVALLPTGETCDRSQLWNAAEAAEKRKDARTAREWIVALPAELDQHQRLLLATDFAVELGQRFGVAVDVAIHEPDTKGDQRNHHAHILTTTRKAEMQNGELVLGDKATIELSDKKRGELKLGKAKNEVKAIRGIWADMANEYLGREGHEERIDHRTLKEQGIDKVASVHLGPIATQMERNGKTSDRGDLNREAQKLEAEIISLKKERDKREQQQNLNPENIEKVWKATLQEAKALVSAHKQKLENNLNAAKEQHSRCFSAEPQPPEGLFSGFKRGSYEKAHAAWKAEEKRLRSIWINARGEKEDDRSDAFFIAKQGFEKRHPEMAKERDRYQELERQKSLEKLRKEREAMRQRNRSRGRGGMER